MIRTASVVLLAAQLFGGGERNTREGAEHFEAGRLEEALRAFSRAEGAHPDAPENDLNIAGVHYRMGEAEEAPRSVEEGPLAEALRGYQAALQAGLEGDLGRDASFNLGNSLFRSGAFREAAAAYGEAIALDPDDLEARQNLERALRRAEEEQQEQQRGGQNQDDRQEQEPQDQPDQDQPDQDQQNQQEQQQSGGDPSPPGEGEGSESDQPPPEGSPDEGERPPGDDSSGNPPRPEESGADQPDAAPSEVPEVSPEQAERILAALADIERAFQEERLQERRARALRRGRH